MTDTFVVECSDDDNYDNSVDNYRLVNGKKVWEPSGAQIAALYRQLEAKGFIELRWQCPGRRSPSVHNIALPHKTEPNTDSEANVSDSKTSGLLNEFDFDNELSGQSQSGLAVKTGPTRKRLTSQVKSKQTNLSKVMQDIKKYQFVDQTRRLSLNTTSAQVTSQVTVSSAPNAVTSGQPTVTQPSNVTTFDVKPNVIDLPKDNCN